MKNLNNYKRRFNILMESTMGDVRPLINEVEGEPDKKGEPEKKKTENEPIDPTSKEAQKIIDQAEELKKQLEKIEEEKKISKIKELIKTKLEKIDALELAITKAKLPEQVKAEMTEIKTYRKELKKLNKKLDAIVHSDNKNHNTEKVVGVLTTILTPIITNIINKLSTTTESGSH